MDQVKRFIFPNLHKTIAKKRLAKLQQANFIKRDVQLINHKLSFYFSITKKSLPYLEHECATPLIRCELKSGQIKHDFELVEIAEKIKYSPQMIKYHSENVLLSYQYFSESTPEKSFVKCRSDAMLMINVDGTTMNVAIEFESTAKAKDRWAEKIKNYYSEWDINGVLYFCSNNGVLKSLQKTEAELNLTYKPKIYMILTEDFKSQNDFATFTNFTGETFSLYFH